MSESDTSNGKLGYWSAVAIGIGGMVGGGIFAVLGLAVQLAHGGTPIAALITLISIRAAESLTTLRVLGGMLVLSVGIEALYRGQTGRQIKPHLPEQAVARDG